MINTLVELTKQIAKKNYKSITDEEALQILKKIVEVNYPVCCEKYIKGKQ